MREIYVYREREGKKTKVERKDEMFADTEREGEKVTQRRYQK